MRVMFQKDIDEKHKKEAADLVAVAKKMMLESKNPSVEGNYKESLDFQKK